MELPVFRSVYPIYRDLGACFTPWEFTSIWVTVLMMFLKSFQAWANIQRMQWDIDSHYSSFRWGLFNGASVTSSFSSPCPVWTSVPCFVPYCSHNLGISGYDFTPLYTGHVNSHFLHRGGLMLVLSTTLVEWSALLTLYGKGVSPLYSTEQFDILLSVPFCLTYLSNLWRNTARTSLIPALCL